MKAHPGVIAAWTLLGLVAVYVLSIGPAARLGDVGILSHDALEAFYYPLVLLAKVPLIGDLLRAWVDLWHTE